MSLAPSEDTKDVVIPAFPFPFTPYKVQQELMESVFKVIEEGKIGVMESPTGTGKSLSLLVSSLTWLLDHHPASQLPEESSSSNDWVNQFARGSQVRAFKSREQAHAKLKDKMKGFQPVKKRKQFDYVFHTQAKSEKKEKSEAKVTPTKDDDSAFVIAWEEENTDELTKLMNDMERDDAEETIARDARILRAGARKGQPVDPDRLEMETPKLIFASRTHSQLTQIIAEVRKTAFADRVRCVSLGSRRQLCINPVARRAKSNAKLNEKCQEIRNNGKNSSVVSSSSNSSSGDVTAKKRKKKIILEDDGMQDDSIVSHVHEDETQSGCPYLKNVDKQFSLRNFILTDVLDVEQAAAKGEELQTCPYYASRKAVENAHLITMPYSSLIVKNTREALGVDVKDNIVIIDEAHNLIDALNSGHTVSLSLSLFVQVRDQVDKYIARYKTRLKGIHLTYLKQLLFIIKACTRFLSSAATPVGKPSSSASSSPTKPTTSNAKGGVKVVDRILSVNDFVFEVNADNVNLFKLERFIHESKLVEKLSGFVDAYHGNQVEMFGAHSEANPQTGAFIMYALRDFLGALTNANEDGRIVVQQIWKAPKVLDGQTVGKPQISVQSTIKYLMLNPAVSFSQIVKDARAVLLVGGTMQPFDHFAGQLFADPVAAERLSFFTCNHVVPDSNLLALSLDKGPTGKAFEFTFTQRNDVAMIVELGSVMVNICSLVPGGVVCFFPSYAYEAKVCSVWEQKGIAQRIRQKKRMVREPREASQVEHVWAEYVQGITEAQEEAIRADTSSSSSSVKPKKGSFMTCVVGGKMSEGINFSDALARCVIVVGLPYPNSKDPVLLEKMRYVDATMKAQPRQALSTTSLNTSPGNIYYENLCMRAVNQSIGRAIRHINDYATIVMIDKRYGRSKVETQLPGWIRKRLSHEKEFGPFFNKLRHFFVDKKTAQQSLNEEKRA